MSMVHIDRDLADLVEIFLEKRRKDMILIKEKLGQDDIQGIRLIAHGIKGSAGSYGFDEMSAIAEEIERKAEHADRSELEDLCGRLERHMDGIEVVYTGPETV